MSKDEIIYALERKNAGIEGRITKLEDRNIDFKNENLKLTAYIAELKAALKPFSRYDKHIDDDEVYNYQARSGDVRRAKELTDE